MSESREQQSPEPNKADQKDVKSVVESKGMPADDADTLGRAVYDAAKMDADKQAIEEAHRLSRRKALEIIFYANEHIRKPCGGSPEEQAYQRKIHQQAVNEALLEPGVLTAMTDDEVRHLNTLLKMK